MQKLRISCSIVIFDENFSVLEKAIISFLNIPFSKKLFIIDNSKETKFDFSHPCLEYIKNSSNIGFGNGHNVLIDTIKDLSEFHLILNPDVAFESSIFEELFVKLSTTHSLGIIAPKVVSSDGKLQYTCRKNPTVKEMVSRRLGLFKSYTHQMEYRDRDLSLSFNPEFIHGCFLLFKTEDFIAINGFDPRYFLYLEDADICREMVARGKKILYYPNVAITHIHRKGSAKSYRLFFYHLSSAIKYFKKWGIF